MWNVYVPRALPFASATEMLPRGLSITVPVFATCTSSCWKPLRPPALTPPTASFATSFPGMFT